MAHYALIDANKIVTNVIVGRDEYEVVDGVSDWESYYSEVTNLSVLKTSYNTYGGMHYTTDDEGNRVPSDDQSQALRFNYAGIGFTYDETRDAFIPPTPYPSWVLDEGTCLWVAPIAYPAEGDHVWDEEAGDWVEVIEDTVE
jgi:hypothetical protein